MTIAQKFEELKRDNEAALIPFIMGGDPPLERLPKILQLLASSGADLIEVGLPHSDPIADGPVIQASSQRALDRGVTPKAVIEKIRQTNLEVPIIVMGYANTFRCLGFAAAAKLLAAAGVAGVIVSDLLPEEAGEWLEATSRYQIDTIFLASQTSTDARLAAIAARSSGFIYAIARTGVTGTFTALGAEVGRTVDRIRNVAKLPICVGFGISSVEQVRYASAISDGVIVGSYLVKEFYGEHDDLSNLAREVAMMKEATRRTGS